MRIKRSDRKATVAVVLAMTAAIFITGLAVRAYAQDVRKTENVNRDEDYRRPVPRRPIRPEIPDANRFRQDKVFLEAADSLFKVNSRDTVERQIVKGNVKFRQAGMWMFCDSAYYYPELNSLDAFGHVRMEQGDTLFVYADRLYYEGNDRMARLKNGESCKKVRLVNRDVTLTTDSLDYDLAEELGWYERWGTIDDKVNTLTSLFGQYSPNTKDADFFNDVVLVNNRDGYTMLTDTLFYNTVTHIARIASPTEIQGANDTIVTRKGLYDTDLGNAILMSRSVIMHRDSNNNVTTLEGDSIVYDKASRISRAYMFSGTRGVPMVLTDTAHRVSLIGGFGLYNDSTREALATDYPLLMEYSQGDTLFLRADSIKTYIVSEKIYSEENLENTISILEKKVICSIDSGGIWLDSLFFSVEAPLARKASLMLESKYPMQKKDEVKHPVSNPALRTPVNPVRSPKRRVEEELKEVGALEDGEENPSIVNPGADIPDDVNPDEDNPVENNTNEEPEDNRPFVLKEYHQAQAYHRARFFKQDLQGVADSIVVNEKDSMMFMFRKPIVWSGERQVTGNRIDVHFNDSTADWALLPESGLMSEHVGEDFYNQLAGKKLFATFANQTLKTLDVSGNVETIFLPQESDSTYNRMIAAESSYLTIEMDSGKMSKMKMWPEVNGTVTPLFLVKKQNQYLRQFRWWVSLRPEREKIGNRWKWNDNLGEVSDDLEMYFTTPSDFGEPKSFSASRPTPVVPPVSNVLSNPESEIISAEQGEDAMRRLEKEAAKEAERIEDAVTTGDPEVENVVKTEAVKKEGEE